jgi:predicted  nucleic acid-binding Zn-ribbon protein
MGSGASIDKDERFNEQQLKDIVGIYWSKVAFDECVEERSITVGCDEYSLISLKEFEEKIRSIQVAPLIEKYCNVSPFERDLWTPLLYSSFYESVWESDLLNCFEKKGVDFTRTMLLQSLEHLGLYLDKICCLGSCEERYAKGVRCRGLVSLTGARTAPIMPKKPHDDDFAFWKNIESAHPDDLAVHLWTFSMTRGPADPSVPVYCRLNKALLEEDDTALRHFAPMIVCMLRWLRMHSLTRDSDVTLYRGTPINAAQEHAPGSPLHPRFSLADFVSATDEAARMKAQERTDELLQESSSIFRVPMFVAASEDIDKAQEFCGIDKRTGTACPVLEFKIDAHSTLDTVAPIMMLSHFPEEREWLMGPYTPLQYVAQRLEFFEIGPSRSIKVVKVITYRVLNHGATFAKFEKQGVDVKSALAFVTPYRVYAPETLCICPDVDINTPFEVTSRSYPRSRCFLEGSMVCTSMQKPVRPSPDDEKELTQSEFVWLVCSKIHDSPYLLKSHYESCLPRACKLQPLTVAELDGIERAQRLLMENHQGIVDIRAAVDSAYSQLDEANSEMVDPNENLKHAEALVFDGTQKISRCQEFIELEERELAAAVARELTTQTLAEDAMTVIQASREDFCRQREKLSDEVRDAKVRFRNRKIDTVGLIVWEESLKSIADEEGIKYIEFVFPTVEYDAFQQKLDSELTKLTDFLASSREGITDLRMKITERTAEINHLENKRKQDEANADEARKKVAELQARVDEIEERLHKLKLQKDFLEASFRDLSNETAEDLWTLKNNCHRSDEESL